MTGGWARLRQDVASFGREILIVVIGVALGLWAQQLASEAGWRETVKNAKEDFRRELQESVNAGVYAVEMRGCLPAYLKIARTVALGQARRPLPRIAGVVALNPEDAAWQAAASSQVFGHLSHKALEDYAYAYTLTRQLRETNAPMDEALAILKTLDTPRATRDPVVMQMHLEAIARLELQQTMRLERVDEMLTYLAENLKLRPTTEGRAGARAAGAMCMKVMEEPPPARRDERRRVEGALQAEGGA